MTRTYILFIFCLIAVFSLPASAVDLDSLVKSDVSHNNFPLDESVVLYEGIHYTLYSDGRISQRVHRIRALFTENSLDNNGDIFVNFCSDKQELKIERARGHLIDGTVTDSYENAFNQITPGSLGSAPDFLPFQEMVITHTGLEWSETSPLGSKSELIYTIEDREPFQPWLEGIEFFQSDEYILRKEVKITAPAETKLKSKFLNGSGNLKQDIQGDIKTWTWTMSNIPHIIDDDAYEYRMNFVPTLIFSTCADWKTAAQHYARKIKDAVGSSEIVESAAEEAVEGLLEEKTAPQKIAEYISENVRTINHHHELFILHHRNAERTLAARYGNTFDKAILLAAMLKSQGLPADIALSAGVYQQEFTVPSLVNFHHLWVVTVVDGVEVFIDPLKPLSSSSYKDLGGQAVFRLDMTGNQPAVIPDYTVDDSKIILNLKVKIADNGSYTGSGYFLASGYFSPYHSVITNSGGAGDWLNGRMKGLLPNIKIENGAAKELYSTKTEFNFDFSGENLGEAVNGYLAVEIPQPPIDITALEPSGLHTSYMKRGNPVFFRGAGSQSMELKIELPEKWSIARSPADISEELSVGTAVLKSKEGDGKVKMTIQKSITEKVVQPEDYNMLKRLYTVWNTKSNQVLVFKN